jgi:hypothetical protein
VHQGTPSQTSHLREFSKALRYNSPDMSGAHRTVSSAPEESNSELASFGNPLRYNSPDMSGAPPDSLAGPHVRAPMVGTQQPGDVAGAPDSVRWRTGLSGAPCDSSLHQTASLVVGVINTPKHTTFKVSKFLNFQPLTRARHSIQDTPK